MRNITILAITLALVACIISACSGGGSPTAQLTNTPGGVAAIPGLKELAAPDGFDTDLWQQMKEKFADELAIADAMRNVAGAPSSPGSQVTDFRVSFDLDNDAIFEWTYRNTGDYDQNSEVNLADITQIALNFMKTTSSPDWSAASAADGDGNGEINLSDITPIAVNYRNNVASYALKTALTSDSETWDYVESVDFSNGTEPPSGGLLGFSHSITNPQLVNGNYYQVTPDDGSIPAPGGALSQGMPSNNALVSFVTIPQNLTPTTGSIEGEVRLVWDAMATAQYFHVFRADAVDGSYIEIGQSSPGENTFTDATVLEGVHYWYKVSAELNSGESEQSDPAEGWSNTAPDAPTNVMASDGTSSSGITISWDKPVGANGYKVFRDTEDFQVATLGDVDSWEDTTILDTDLHTFWVSAVSFSLESALSDPDDGFLGTAPAISSVTPEKLYHGDEVTLGAIVSGDLPITYAWDFGGGATPNTSSDESPIVTIAASESYSGTLTCTNAAGQDVFPFSVGEPWFTELLIVYNSDIPESQDLAEYYASPVTGRAIHPDYVLGLPLGTAEKNITRENYNLLIRDPLITHLDASGYKETIKYICLFKGVPYRISNDGNGAVDSEMCMLYEDGNYLYSGRLWSGNQKYDFNNSQYYEGLDGTEKSFQPFQYSAVDDAGGSYTVSYLVGRISAYTYDEAKLSIDRSLNADTSGNGWMVMDTHMGWRASETMTQPVWGFALDDTPSLWEIMDTAGYNYYLDNEFTVSLYDDLPTGAGDNVIGYSGWGVNHTREGGNQYPSGKMYILDDLGFTYLPGAAWVVFESYAAQNMEWDGEPGTHHGSQGQICDFIRMGGTVAAGNVYEPFTDGVPDERRVFERYLLKGDRWIEACYKGIRYLSWHTVVLGDPLCRVVSQ